MLIEMTFFVMQNAIHDLDGIALLLLRFFTQFRCTLEIMGNAKSKRSSQIMEIYSIGKCEFIVSYWLRNILCVENHVYYKYIIHVIADFAKTIVVYVIGCNTDNQFGIGLPVSKKNSKKQECIDTKGKLCILQWSKTKIIQHIYQGHRFCIYQTRNGDYLTAGCNLYGQCLHNSKNQPFVSNISPFVAENINIQTIFASRHANTGFIMDKMNKLYTFGYFAGEHKQTKQLTYFAQIKPKINIKDIRSAAEYDLTLFLTSNGNVYHTKANSFGWTHSFGWIEQLSIKNIIQIDCGFGHFLLLNQNGILYVTAVYNSFGQLGNGQQDISLKYKKNPFVIIDNMANKYLKDNNIKIKQIAAGLHYSLALSVDGKIYSWGYNVSAQCGYGQSQKAILIPRQIQSLNDIKTIQCGSNHSMAIDINNEVFMWGQNQHNQCIVDEQQICIAIPTPTTMNHIFRKLIAQNNLFQIEMGVGHTKILTIE
eukprot:186151_1